MKYVEQRCCLLPASQSERGGALIDVPNAAFSDKFLACLAGACDPKTLSHVFITHLDPKSIPTLLAVLEVFGWIVSVLIVAC